jgi:glutamate transport system permease protein
VFWALVAGLTLYNSAVLGEIFRAGILSLPKGQTEAAYSIGLRRPSSASSSPCSRTPRWGS